MDRETQKRLEAINLEFYNARAIEFANTRAHPWRGWEIIWDKIKLQVPKRPTILDIGCGNGRFGEFCLKHLGAEFSYIGVEPVKALSDMALQNLSRIKKLVIWNFTAQNLPPIQADILVSFGVLHHLPGIAARTETIKEFMKLVKPQGVMSLSFWQATKSTNLVKRRASGQELENLGISENALEANDMLLPFGQKENSWRYVHAFTDKEIDNLIQNVPWKIVADFKSDGADTLANRYLVWQASPPPQVEGQ